MEPILGTRERRALNRLGDLMVPGDNEFPSYSELGCAERADDMLAYGDPDDVALLMTALRALSIMPAFVLRLVCWAAKNADRFPGPLGNNLRLFNIALRGLTVSLYFTGKTGAAYQGKTPHELIGFELNRVPK